MANHPVRPPEWIDTAPITVREEIGIAAPPAAVWPWIADHARWPEWFTVLDRVEVVGSPTGVGGGRRVGFRGLTLTEEFTAWEPERHFAFAVIRSPLPVLGALAESVLVEATDTGSRVVYRQGLAPRRGTGPLLRLLWRGSPGAVRAALERLRSLVEGQTSGQG